MRRLVPRSFGPFVGGVVDGRNSSLDGTGLLRFARHCIYSGQGRLMAAPGTAVVMTLLDDAGSPAEITSVLRIVPFGDDCLAVGHSTVTDEVYLYRLKADFSGWYASGGALTSNATAEPLGVLWSAITSPPRVTVAEILGVAYIAHAEAASASALTWRTRTWNGSSIADLTADIDGTGADPVYFSGVDSFQGHLLGWGYDQGTAAATAYRPEMVRHGAPDGGALDADGRGSLTVGHRIRSARERVVATQVCDEVCYIGTTYSVWGLTGYGRDSFQRIALEDSYGFISLTGQCNAGGVCYYWSPRGPMRVRGLAKPEALYDRIPELVASVVDPEKIVCGYDPDRDRVLWYFRGTGVSANRLVCAFDVRRDLFLGPDSDAGIYVGAAGLVAPVQTPTAAAASGPAGAPTTAVTSGVSAGSATAAWTNGDATVGVTTVVEVRLQATSTWTTAATVAAGVATALISGLAAGSAYEWRVYHRKNGQSSSALGPAAATQFTTTTTLAPPTGLTLTDVGPKLTQQGLAQWSNSGEADVITEVTLDDVLVATLVSGESSYYVSIEATDSYDVKVRHTKSGYTASSYAGPASATLTYGESF